MTVNTLRRRYTKGALLEKNAPSNPYALFETWLQDAIDHCTVTEANAMTLATVDSSLRPHTRIVLLKGHNPSALTFYTNYSSNKGKELAGNPNAALQFFWPELERQIRVEGIVQQASPSGNQAYFSSRPRGSQLGAMASPQSHIVANRDALDARLEKLQTSHAEHATLVCPSHWGGYHLHPHYWEFWQGRDNRMHDRLRYTVATGNTDKTAAAWDLARLAP